MIADQPPIDWTFHQAQVAQANLKQFLPKWKITCDEARKGPKPAGICFATKGATQNMYHYEWCGQTPTIKTRIKCAKVRYGFLGIFYGTTGVKYILVGQSK